MGFELKRFQAESANQIAKRYAFFATHPDRPRKGVKPRPFFQALSALTGAGKTPILAHAVALMRAHSEGEPIILWMSRARSVVAQTLTNFAAGKYADLVEDCTVIPMRDLRPALIDDDTNPLLVLTTTGLFNNKDQADGALQIYRTDNDQFGERSPWERLITRSATGRRRPLFVVYDEGHNLSAQQSSLLAELEPDAYLLASATLRLPTNFQQSVIQPISLWVDEAGDSESFKALGAVDEVGNANADLFVTTAVSSTSVVDAGLVKRAIQFDGTTAPMEQCVSDLMDRLQSIQAELDALSVGIQAKAIYVCKTNITDDGETDDPTKPFSHRQAPPIRIWRYLVDEKGVSPDEIAIYANLAFNPGTKPDEVRLFSKGESDFDDFSVGAYRHVIFNLSLQEGWDDPACYLAYVDKSMGSSIQVEQVIGRVLRQPQATHFSNPLLNSAHFFLRVDKEAVFTDTLDKIKDRLSAEGVPIAVVSNYGGAASTAQELYPKDDTRVELHHVFVDSESARQQIAETLAAFPSFQPGDGNTIGKAHVASQVVEIGSLNEGGEQVEWKPSGSTNPVRLRWLVANAIKARSARALAVTDLSHQKFDIRVQVQSIAANMVDKLAGEIVTAFYDLSDLVYESGDPVGFGAMRVGKGGITFKNGLYERYSEFNSLELALAKAVDKTGLVWHRNPANGGYYIPLLSEGDTASFYPDFIVWRPHAVYCIDTKGAHILTDAVARKLFDVQEDGVTKLHLRFVTQGRQTALREKPTSGGFTVWRMKTGKATALHVDTMAKAVAAALK